MLYILAQGHAQRFFVWYQAGLDAILAVLAVEFPFNVISALRMEMQSPSPASTRASNFFVLISDDQS